MFYRNSLRVLMLEGHHQTKLLQQRTKEGRTNVEVSEHLPFDSFVLLDDVILTSTYNLWK